jgi:hypothetical protein
MFCVKVHLLSRAMLIVRSIIDIWCFAPCFRFCYVHWVVNRLNIRPIVTFYSAWLPKTNLAIRKKEKLTQKKVKLKKEKRYKTKP